MDRYLHVKANFNRLLNEWNKYGSLCIGVDFDDTLYDTHNQAYTYNLVRQLVRDLHSIGSP